MRAQRHRVPARPERDAVHGCPVSINRPGFEALPWADRTVAAMIRSLVAVLSVEMKTSCLITSVGPVARVWSVRHRCGGVHSFLGRCRASRAASSLVCPRVWSWTLAMMCSRVPATGTGDHASQIPVPQQVSLTVTGVSVSAAGARRSRAMQAARSSRDAPGLDAAAPVRGARIPWPPPGVSGRFAGTRWPASRRLAAALKEASFLWSSCLFFCLP